MILLRSFLLFIFFLSQALVLAQNTDFQSYPDFEISISPNIPFVCPGEAIKVICNEHFEDYEWEGVGFEFQAFGKEVNLTNVGQYTLTVKGEIDGNYYYKILNFYTGSNDSDGDGICDPKDCQPQNPFASEGMACDDGNPCTERDVFNEDCKCQGVQVTDCEIQNSSIHTADKLALERKLTEAFASALKKDDDSLNAADQFRQLSTIPHAQNLLKTEIISEINGLSSSEIKKLFLDLQSSQFSPGFLGHELESLSVNNIKAWRGISQGSMQFRIKTSIQDSVYNYMVDFDKDVVEVANEISEAKKGYLWWYQFVLGRKYWKTFLDDMDKINDFAVEIINHNKNTEGGGRILSGRPLSAINTALYYDDVLEQGASIFKTIIKNHMFYDGNKRTAMNTIKSFMNKAGIPIHKTDKKIFKLAKKVATDQVVEVSEIANKLIK